MKAFSSAYGTVGHRTLLYNITDASITLTGSNAGVAGTNIHSESEIEDVFTIASAKQFYVQTYQKQAIATQGLGHDISTGDIELYTDIKFWKVG